MLSGVWKRLCRRPVQKGLSSEGEELLSIFVCHLVPHCLGLFDHARWLALVMLRDCSIPWLGSFSGFSQMNTPLFV